MLRFDRLQTPPGDGDTLIEPSVCRWTELVAQNARLRSTWRLTLAGVPFETVRQVVRARLGASADVPVIASGHQPAFVHPGVWAKQVVVRHAAHHLGVRGVDLVVDHDAPRSAGLEVPVVGEDGHVSRREIGFTAATAGSGYEGRPALDVLAVGTIREELAAALGERFAASLMPRYLEGLACPRTLRIDRLEAGPTPVLGQAPKAQSGAGDAVEQHVAARAAIDAELGADLAEYRVSEVFGGPFVADLLLEADRFAAAYNASLGEYRREEHVRGADRPLPDLGREAGRVETAMWVYQPGQRRRRLWIEPHGDRIDLYADQAQVASLAAGDIARDVDAVLAEARPWVVRPRALALTLWARLLACDLFVHGIGGAKYDRITDGIIRRYHGCEPPAYACVSATLRLPLPRHASTADDVLAARRRVRDWRYNPDRYLTDAPVRLLEERRRLIGESDRLREMRGDRAARRHVFLGIRRLNAQLAESDPAAGSELVGRLECVQRELASNQAADWREYFYLLHTRERLVDLAERLVPRPHA